MTSTYVIDFDALDHRLVHEDKVPVLILVAATHAQRHAAAEFARATAGRLLAEDHEPMRSRDMDAPTPLQRGFSVAVTQIETPVQAEEYLPTLRRDPRRRYRGFVLVVPPALAEWAEGPLAPWVREGIVAHLAKDSEES